MRIAVLRCERLPSFVTWEVPDLDAVLTDDRRLLAAFAGLGVDAEPVVWSRRGVDWNEYDGAVLRSTWDYVDRLDDFIEVTAAIAASRCVLLNPVDAVHWNVDKRYLDHLAGLGVPIVPLVRGRAGHAGRLHTAAVESGWHDLVLKPAVGVGGSGVISTDVSGLAAALGEHPPQTEVMVQPFAEAIVGEGELSFAFIGDGLSHTLRKRPVWGDFRAHGIYGGTIEPIAPDPEDVAAVEAMRARLPFDLLYARFDVVRYAGRLAVLELELIEPILYFDLAPGSAERFAAATIARLGR